MATNFEAPDLRSRPLHMDTHGNAWIEHYKITASAGVGDKLYFGIIPAGVEVSRVRLVSPTTQASVVMDLGYEPVDPGMGPLADGDYWLDNADIAAAGADDSLAPPKRFEQPVYLVGEIGGDDTNGAKTFYVDVIGKAVGVK